ncbi:glycosyltransferase family 4 protein [Vibrio tetraodonis]|uniref:glycosyltransferase family 4 protein n=1 Tax=Vibrio tetraodonis TaxID=2231647 RepID=UPI000E0AAA93|nr:glycosyltransferase family 4 protein [Vibrio tetraodonis]
MHLVLVIDDYLPYSTRVAAKMFHELATTLVSYGYYVTVITPIEEQKEKLTKIRLDGVNVWRFSSGAIKNTSKVRRAINESMLSLRAWNAISNEIDRETFDGIVYYSPSIFFGYLIGKIKSRCKCNSYLILRDLFPQWIVDAGLIKKGSLVEKYFRIFEAKSYQQADIIGLMSENNLSIFNELTDNKYPTEVLRNWAELRSHNVPASDNSIRAKLSLQNKVIFFYGGNIGHAQDMGNLMRLTRKMSHHSSAHFLYIGQGDEVTLINELAEKWQLTNFTYLPSVSQSEFKDILAEVNVGLFSLSAMHTAHNFPGKLLGYMVQSLPILGSVNTGNDLQGLINSHHAGLIAVNGEDDILYENAVSFLDASKRKKFGENAYQLLKEQFSVESAAQAIISRIRKS